MCGAHTAPEIGYAFNPELWGRGYATEAIKGLVDKYWEVFPQGHPSLEGEEREYLVGYTARSNLASQAALKKNGFSFWKEIEESPSLDGGEKVMLMVWRRWKPGLEPREELASAETT